MKMAGSTDCAMAVVGGVLDDTSTKFLGDAFDAVLGMLHGTHYPDEVREVLADRVIEFGRTTSGTRSAAVGARRARESGDQIVKGMRSDAAPSYQAN
jgi:hypothetical protein